MQSQQRQKARKTRQLLTETRRRSLHDRHIERRKDARVFMPMPIVFVGDPALQFRCAETRTFLLIPDKSFNPNKNMVEYMTNRIGFIPNPFSRLEYYGFKQGIYYKEIGLTRISTSMVQREGLICYFKNAV